MSPYFSSATGELFLRFCAFVRQLGMASGRKPMLSAVLNLLGKGKVEERWVEEACPQGPGSKQLAGDSEVRVSVWMD